MIVIVNGSDFLLIYEFLLVLYLTVTNYPKNISMGHLHFLSGIGLVVIQSQGSLHYNNSSERIY